MHNITSMDCSRIAQDLQIRKVQVESVVALLDEGNTVPFITRYRKERTGGLNEEVIRQIQHRTQFLRQLADRKQTILKSIETQGKLTDELRQAIVKADTTKRLEDLYLPYKPKKRSQANKAREQGLEPLALAIWHSDPAVGNLDEMLPALVNPEKDLKTPEEVKAGVQNILAEMMAETAIVRAAVRSVVWETGKITSVKSEKVPEGMGLEYKDYFQFTEPARQIPPHRILALNRGEKEQALKVKLELNLDAVRDISLKALAEHLLKVAGQMPAPSAPPPPAPEAVAAGVAQVSGSTGDAAPQGTEATASEASPPPTPEQPPSEQQASPEPQPAAESPPAEQQQGTDAPPSAEIAAPLVATMVAPQPVVLQGEPLVPDLEFKSPHVSFLKAVLEDSLNRLLLPSLEREVRRELTDEAEGHAVVVFARNLRSLLMQPPLRGKRVLAIDPGFRTGCKVAALDEYGNLLEHTIVYPHSGKKGRDKGDKPPKAEQTATAAPQGVSEPPANPTPDAAPSAEQATTPSVEAAAPQPDAETPSAPENPPEAPPATETPTSEPAAAAIAIESTPPAAATPEPAAVDRRAEAKAKLQELVAKHHLNVAALGNGTGCRETEEIIADLIATGLPDLSYVIVNEAGASVYSVSPVGREEFPTFDATLRSAISIGRRLQDPLSELVKIDPQSIGVGLYQHDMSRKELKDSLEAVVESSVNQVGVDLNTASVSLLRYVSGLNQLVARELVDHRKQHGPFQSREALLQVPNLGQQRFTQAAGFLKIPSSPNPLDQTWIHPESYGIAEQILNELGFAPAALNDKSAREELQAKLQSVNVEEMAKKLNAGVPTVHDILQALARPGLDPREDLPPPIFKKGILKLEDLQPGMELKGTVLNVVDFGAFVDIGLKDSGLVHISQMANRYIKSPYEVAAVNDVVEVWVLAVDKDRHRVSLTMIKPGTERKPPEKGQPRGPRDGGRPPRGRRPEGVPGQQQASQPQPQGEGQERRPPPRGRGPARRPGPGGPGGPRSQHGHGQGPRPSGTPQGGAGSAGASSGAGDSHGSQRPEGQRQGPPPRQVPPPPPRKPRREPPKPKLSQDALEGKVPLRTFSELGALWAAKRDPKPEPKPQTTPAPEAAPAASSEATATPAEPTAAPVETTSQQAAPEQAASQQSVAPEAAAESVTPQSSSQDEGQERPQG